MILFSSHINCSTTNTIQNIFINLKAIKARVISNIKLRNKVYIYRFTIAAIENTY